MDEKDIVNEQDETVADAIIGSIIDVDSVSNISKETIANAIEVGANALVGIEADDNNSDNEGNDKEKADYIIEDESSASKKPKKKKLRGSFFLGVASVIFALLAILCCCTLFPLCIPFQLLFLTLAIVFFLLDKKYNGKTGFSISALVGIIFSICIVVFTLIWVCVMLIFGLVVKPAVEPWFMQSVLSPIAGFFGISLM